MRRTNMKMHLKTVLAVSICTASGAAVMAGCKNEAEEPEPEVSWARDRNVAASAE